jgi:hypothetical protein
MKMFLSVNKQSIQTRKENSDVIHENKIIPSSINKESFHVATNILRYGMVERIKNTSNCSTCGK